MKIQKILSISLITLLLFSFIPIAPTQAQSDPPPNKPDAGTLALLNAYVEKAYASTSKKPAPPEALPSPVLVPNRLAKAKPDECFNGVGQPYSGTLLNNCSDSPIFIPGVTQPKVNQAYVWGLTQYHDDLWFGTAANVLCLVYGGFLNMTGSMQTPSYVCEFGQSRYSPPAPAILGDYRPPKAYMYDTVAGGDPVDKSVNQVNFPTATITDTLRFTNTVGLRSAGVISSTVFLAGPALTGGGINMFAYNAVSGGFIGSTNLPAYNNIRKWVNVDGVLYTGVAKDPAYGGGGAVLRYTGNPSLPGEVFKFVEVGRVGSDAAELAVHNGRLYVSTWPSTGVPAVPAALWMSPPIPPTGLTALDYGSWRPVWSIMSYDPDPVTAALTGGGALASNDGWLYWGTMHVPFVSYEAHMKLYPPDPTWDQATLTTYQLSTLLGTHRAISVFRGRDFGTPSQTIELLYGEQSFPAFLKGSWVVVPNLMGGVAPTFGHAGFGNFYNNYTWSMGVFKDQLYVGTMDWSYLLEDGLSSLTSSLGLPAGTPLPLPNGNPGADLWRFKDAYTPAEAINTDGLGNPLNYGIRTMLPGDKFYLGTANPMNLKVNQPQAGGWELVQMLEVPQQPDLAIRKTVSTGENPVAPGDDFSYTLEVTNFGYGEATHVTVQDTLPAGVIFKSDNLGVCSQSGQEITCGLGALGGYDGSQFQSASVTLNVTAPDEVAWLVNQAEVSSDQADADLSNNRTALWTLIDNSYDLRITKSVNKEWAGSGQMLRYSLTATNLGPSDFIANVPVSNSNPEAILIPSFGTATPYPSNALSFAGLQGKVGKVTVTLHGLTHVRTADLNVMLVSPSGKKVMLMADAGGGLNFNSNLELTFDDDATQNLPQSTGIISGTYRPTSYSLTPPYFPPPVPIGPVSSALSAFQGDDPNGVWALYVEDDLLGYSGVIANGWTLNLSLKRGQITDILPDLLRWDTITSPAPWDCQVGTGQVISCRPFGDLVVNQPYTILLDARVVSDPPVELPVKLTNSVTLAAEAFDPNLANNQDSVTIDLLPPPDLEIEKSTAFGNIPITPGQAFTYTLTARNLGPGPASGVVALDELPQDTTFVDADPRCSFEASFDQVSCSLGDLDVSEVTSAVISVTAPNTVTWITNQASISGEQTDADEDNQATLWSLVDNPVHLEIEKTASSPTVVVSQTLTYTVAVTNHGPSEFVSQVPFNIHQPEPITIPGFGTADPYPSSTVAISGLSGVVDRVTVDLQDLWHGRTSDLDVMLVSPNGTKVLLMSKAGNAFAEGVDLTFDDAASQSLPQNAPIVSGTYLPTAYGSLPPVFPAPAPAGVLHSQLSALQGEDPNGAWQLYVVDHLLGSPGMINGGWRLNLHLKRAVTVADNLPNDVKFSRLLPGDWSCKVTGAGHVLCTIDALPLGNPVSFQLVTQVKSTSGTKFSNTATVTTDAYAPAPDPNFSTVIVELVKRFWFPLIYNFYHS